MKPSRAALLVFAGLLFLFGVLLVACGDDDSTNTPPMIVAGSPTAAAGAGGPVNVTLADFSYNPASLSATVSRAVTVNLTNAGTQPHSFTIDGVVDSGQLAAGATGRATFTPAQVGTLNFYCTVHGRATMSGQLTVSAGANAPGGGSTVPGSATSGSRGARATSSTRLRRRRLLAARLRIEIDLTSVAPPPLATARGAATLPLASGLDGVGCRMPSCLKPSSFP